MITVEYFVSVTERKGSLRLVPSKIRAAWSQPAWIRYWQETVGSGTVRTFE